MITMIDAENNGDWIVPKSLCSIDKSGKMIFQGCLGCEDHCKKNK